MSQGFEQGTCIVDQSLSNRPQAHIAQQSRREKLRIQSQNISPANPSSFSNLMSHQASPARRISGDEMPVYDTHMMFSEMFNFPTGAELLGVPAKTATVLQHPPSGDANVSGSKLTANQNLGNWRLLNAGQQSQSNSDWHLAPKYIPTATEYADQNVAVAGGGIQFNSLGVVKEGNMGLHAAQADAMQLYLMNPANGDYSQQTHTSAANMLISNPSNGIGPSHVSENDHQKHFVEQLPLHFPPFPQPMSAEVTMPGSGNQVLGSNIPSNLREPITSQTPWQSGVNELLLLPGNGNLQNNQFVSQQLNSTMNWANNTRYVAGSLSTSTQWSQETLEGKVAEDRSGQGLSLSLSSNSQIQVQPFETRFSSPDMVNRLNIVQVSGDHAAKAKSEDVKGFFSSFSSRDHGKGFVNPMHAGASSTMQLHMNSAAGPSGQIAGYANVLRNSKYMRPAQQLLDEFCNVGRGLKSTSTSKPKHTNSFGAGHGIHSATASVQFGGKLSTTTSVPTGTANDSGKALDQLIFSGDRLELQRRKAKLLSMLDEVDRRYRHYCDQMQMVVTSFESVLGMGAAIPYTALASKAMSRHFRCLRDAVSSQIKATSEALGEKESGIPGITRGETPRLRFLEQSLRQQRAFQQVGMLEQEAWRPQRGLPERSVTVLRAWLFEHFLHPYPSDADKHLLARQTGLSRSQVSNWFINARVRLWKPMVEEMYQEEAKESEMNLSPSHNKDFGASEKRSSPADRTVTSNDDKYMNKHGKMADKQSSSDCEDFNHDLSQNGPESSMSVPLDSHLQDQYFESIKGTDRPISMPRTATHESESLSSVNALSGTERKHEEMLDHNNGNKVQGAEVGLQFPSHYNHNGSSSTGLYHQQFGSGDVSLTLGLHHTGGLPVPIADQHKIDNGLFLSTAEDDSNIHHYKIKDNRESHAQNLHSRKQVGNQLLHDFVG